ncbi:hypothetical protein [Pantoea ananatis]|uniref:hypothetical protein n=1 Tax=Pantoea ananas TaxID=553 RepID=UPI001B31061B|nr:hypothetical protein [Pantoea ananatis]
MPDFLSSLHEGMDSARRAEENKKEIDNVFDELNQQLASATDGNVKIIRTTFRILKDDNVWGLVTMALPGNYTSYSGLGVAHTQLGLSPIEVCKWSSDKNGYPCIIEIDKRKLYCEDKESLEYNIAELLKDSSVGNAIIKMMNQVVS